MVAQRLVSERALDCERALPDRREADVGRKNDVWGLLEHSGAGETGGSEHNCVATAFVELSNARFDVPTERDEIEIRALPVELHHPSAGRGSNFRVLRE